MICAEEFDMADDAFALSPISARASLPSEGDYEAISQAFIAKKQIPATSVKVCHHSW